MKAVTYTMYGPPSVLQLKEISKPVPKGDEVLIKIVCSTVSAAAIWKRKGKFPGSMLFTILLRLFSGLTKPGIPVLGVEFSGVVEETGNEVTLFKKGDAVYGTTTGLKQGAYAEYVCVPEKRKGGVLIKKPELLSFEQAAVLPVGAMTALDLLKKAKIQKGQQVLIYGASGSVGTYAVQISKYFGAFVTGVCSSANTALVFSLGAENVIDYTTNDISKSGKKHDIVFDAVGKLKKSTWKKLLKGGGRFCTVKSTTSEKTEYLEILHKMIAEGKLLPVIDKVYSFDQISEAHQYVDSGHKKGNVVISH